MSCRKRIKRAGEREDGGSEQEEDEGGASTPLPSSSRRRLSRLDGSGSDLEPSGEDGASGSEQEDSEEDSQGMEYSGMCSHLQVTQ